MSAVTVWSKPACPQCNAVKRSFKNAGVAFEEKDLLADEAVLEAFKAAGLGSAPIVEAAGHKTFGGFQPDLVAAIVMDYGTTK